MPFYFESYFLRIEMSYTFMDGKFKFVVKWESINKFRNRIVTIE